VGSSALALDLVAVRRGALGVLMFVAPAYAIAFAFRDPDSWFWLVFIGALLFGSMFGGYAAARDRPPIPLWHAAAGAGSGLAIVILTALVVQALQDDLTLTATLVSLSILQIGTAVGCLGGQLAAKGYRP
jgi:hypothetical protein